MRAGHEVLMVVDLYFTDCWGSDGESNRIGPYSSSLKEVTVCDGHEVLMVVDLYFTDCW
jgi:hypothetical protein